MKPLRCWPVVISLLAVYLVPVAAWSQAQIKPYFMLILDNSGSMSGAPLAQAKAAVSNIVNSTGDAVFGLERFRSGGCVPGASGCASCSGGCSTRNDGEIVVGIFEDNQADILRWTDGVCDYGTGQYELQTRSGTPLATSLDEAQGYFISGINNVWGNWPSPIVQDQAAVPRLDHCRPYSVILLTDGRESCNGNPASEATQLRTTTVNGEVYDIRTYAIGFRIAPPNDQIEDIALAGGTDNSDPAYLGFYAQDEVDLALALSQIVQDSLLVEVCNGVDDDCDTLVDEGVQNACGGCGALAEVCNGSDDDCDGQIDEGSPLYCDRLGGHLDRDLCEDPGETVCDGIDDNCNGVIDEGGICGGCVPVAEICDNVDNNCNGRIDDGVTRPCGTEVGECTMGIETCAAGVWGLCSGRGPGTEDCNGLDDDCNGVADGMVEECGTDVGECQAGVRRCDDSIWGDCIGEVPPTQEICDTLDNDCDGDIDEEDPEGGAPCGTDEGECVAGTPRCDDGELVCDGEVRPSPEICDGLDNDCDGQVDETIPIGEPCGSDVGECEPGTIDCLDGEEDCAGEVKPSDEVCDGLDNDCDWDVDEGLAEGGPCGKAEGICEPGHIECLGGREQCVDNVVPREETCDCQDEDCDGGVDEDPNLCPEGSACIDCSCRRQCDPIDEFTCAFGAECVCHDPDINGTCSEGGYYCFGDRCATVQCEPPLGCNPSTGACGDSCTGVSCESGTRCDVDTGRCRPDDCYYFPADCVEGQACIDGRCAPHPCADVQCAPESFCSGGTCVALCDGITCRPGDVCARGRCVEDPCAGTVCEVGSRCDVTTGGCARDPCGMVTCPVGRICERDGGDCVDDPCLVTVCPGPEYVCELGICGKPLEQDGEAPVQGLATGGGGCVCRTSAPPLAGAEQGYCLLLAALAVLVASRRRRSR